MRILDRINAWLEVDLARDEMAVHCPHVPVGSCGLADCDDQVTADHYN